MEDYNLSGSKFKTAVTNSNSYKKSSLLMAVN